MTVRLLCVGDIHLGKRPSRIPREFGVREAELGPELAWSRAVDEAIERRVHAVLMAGDVVERIEDRFRAFGMLATGVERLQRAGVRTIAVVGNHDVEALPRLAQRFDHVELLGRGADRWERTRIVGEGGAEVDVWGWSYHERIERESPLDSFPRASAREGNTPTIGLLHADLHASASNYAPVKRTALESAAIDAWLLGHVHGPSPLSPHAPIGYLGSISALDPGEPGVHGPWAVDIQRDGQISFEHLALAPVRYDTLDVDVSDLGSSESLTDALVIQLDRAAAAWIEERRTELTRVHVLALRVRLVGATNEGPALRAAAQELLGVKLSADASNVFVEKFVDATHPARDLEELQLDSGYVGLVARRIVGLERYDEVGQRVVAAARERIARDLAEHGAWRELPDAAKVISDGDLRASLTSGARRVLEELVAQRAGDSR